MIAIKNPSTRSMYHNDMLFWIHDGKEYALHVERDDAGINPRKDMDNVGRMFCSHGRYALGDYEDVRLGVPARSDGGCRAGRRYCGLCEVAPD